MENTKAQVHIVSKTDCSESHLVSTYLSLLPPLAANNIRLQVRMVSLTANNLTYARHAAVANWWDAFPVPNFLPIPCNDENTYGIVPVWGFAEIIASRTAGLQTGSIVYGFWPSSTLPVDLQLESTQPVGHYIDTTPHRQSMWSYYYRYTLVPNILDFFSPSLAAELVFKPLFECSHSLNSHVLGPLALHPSQANTPWPSHADLSSTTVISLSASGKTARAFNDSILNARNSPGLKPSQAFIAITSNPETLTLPIQPNSPTATKLLSYTTALSTPTLPNFLNSLTPPASRILIADFGARDNSLAPLVSLLRSHLPPAMTDNLTVVGIGAEPTASSSYSLERTLSSFAAVPERVQMNTSVVREEAIAAVGAEIYFEGIEKGWKGFCQRGGCEGVDVSVGEGVEAFGEGWRRVCEGEADGVGGLAFVF